MFLTGQVASLGQFQVVPRDQVKRRLIELKKGSYRPCYDQGCQIELGRAVAAAKTLSAELVRVGRQCSVNLAVFDLLRETTDKAVSVKGACSEDGLRARDLFVCWSILAGLCASLSPC